MGYYEVVDMFALCSCFVSLFCSMFAIHRNSVSLFR